MSKKHAWAIADRSRGLRLIRQNIAAIQMVMPLAARTPAVTKIMFKGGSYAA